MCAQAAILGLHTRLPVRYVMADICNKHSPITLGRKAREEFQVRKAKIAELREEAGLEELERKAHALALQTDEIDEQIWQLQATSFAGLLGQLEWCRREYGSEEGKLDTIIAGVKRLAGPECNTEFGEAPL